MENKKKSYAELLFDDLESLYGKDEPRAAPCPNCKHYNSDHPNICTAFPEGIPTLILEGQHNHRAPFPGDNGIQWTDSLTKKERKEAVLLLSDNKAGAIYRIALAAKDGKVPDPRDVELLSNKQGRPKKKGSSDFTTEEDYIMENYQELRVHGIKYDQACEILVFLQNLYAEERDEIGVKHIKAIITNRRNYEKQQFLKSYPISLNRTGDTAEEAWERWEEKRKAYLREYKVCWERKFYSKE